MNLSLCSDRVAASVSGQFAKSGAWEDAWRVDRKRLVDLSELRDYIGDSSEIAFESFFDDVFVGVRCRGAPVTLLQFSLACIHALGKSSPKDFALSMDRFIGGESRQPAQFAEIGCVNAWKSVGPIRINRTPYGFPAIEDLWPLVQRSPCGLDEHHAKAIEFSFGGPCDHWIGLPVSGRVGPRAIDADLLAEALTLYAGAEIT
ncbi:hypothetical protein [Rhizobacter sp. Root404]|uniref:hypothetical protein n=1 Tax=Rhizobacter sp. Root404 TaxID=1736528 RepID=UPI0012F7D421|nr:hypothetical protein [Rhizobacter sp. Root404]